MQSLIRSNYLINMNCSCIHDVLKTKQKVRFFDRMYHILKVGKGCILDETEHKTSQIEHVSTERWSWKRQGLINELLSSWNHYTSLEINPGKNKRLCQSKHSDPLLSREQCSGSGSLRGLCFLPLHTYRPCKHIADTQPPDPSWVQVRSPRTTQSCSNSLQSTWKEKKKKRSH